MSTFIKKMKLGKKETQNAGDDSSAAEVTDSQSLKHPPLAPQEVVALSKGLSPVQISSQGLSCHISYKEEKKSYKVVLRSKQQIVSDELIEPTDRKKKAVTDFMFKGLIGIHLHPSGMVLALDQEDNFRGEARANQPPAEIVSGPMTPTVESEDQQRFFTIDLAQCTEETPLLIAPNHGKYHMLVRPLPKTEGCWGLYLSNPKGYVREDSPSVSILKPNTHFVIDREFFTSRATSGDGGIDARNWNKAIVDPILMRMTVDENARLTIEEIFTLTGLTLLLEVDRPVYLGTAGNRTPEQQNTHQKMYADMLDAIRKETQDEQNERGQEAALAKDRRRIVNLVAVGIQKRNQDKVSKLALELAVKEVLAPFYAGAGGSDSVMVVDHQTISLLNAIAGEIVGWVEADTSRALAVSAVEKAIEQAAPLLQQDGLEEMMSLELPAVESHALAGNNSLFGDLVAQAKRLLSSKQFAREIRQVSKDIQASTDKLDQQAFARKLDLLVAQEVHGAFEKTLVRLAVKGYLLQTEKERRTAMGYEMKQVVEAPLTSHELDNILKRYDAYSLYMTRSFDDRMSRPLSSLLQDFQHGANDERERSLSTKPFLTYLIALRSSGGKISAKSDNAPAVSSLQAIPDAIPDISIIQPDPDVAKALIRVIHREGTLLEAPFDLAPRSSSLPDGVPSGLWYAVQDLSQYIMGYYLTGESNQAKDRRQLNAIITGFTTIILQKVANFYRDLKKLPTSDAWDDMADVIGQSTGLLETVSGANPEDELLNLRNRPGHVSEEPLNLKAELRRIIVELEKDGTLDLGAYRFKQQLRSFAMSGMGGSGSSVMLPIKMLAKDGLFVIRSKYNNEVFDKSVRLIREEDVEGVTTVLQSALSSEHDPYSLKPRMPEIKQLSKAAIYKLIHALPFFNHFSVYEKTKISEFDTCFKLFRKGEVILRQESKDIAFFVVIKGHVRALEKGFDLRKYAPGDMFGEMAFLTNQPQSMTIEALTNVLVLRVDQKMFTHLGPESREKFKDHIIDRQVKTLAETTSSMSKRVSTNLQVAPPPDHTNLDGELAQISREEAIDMIEGLSFFDDFSTFEKRRMIAFFTSFRSYQPNGEIIREGMDDDKAFFILIRGEVHVIKGNNIIVKLGPGEFFGDMAFLTNEARTTSVRSIGPVLSLKLDPKLTERLGSEIREKIKDQFIVSLTERVSQTLGLMSRSL
ncbi:MAG: cyclic nucleotide-binding domain-containing protein [Magnetococcales bacterium]|nr:cyclic nucleotide-binding domain-containing protein [Magnetococcales bacterium]